MIQTINFLHIYKAIMAIWSKWWYLWSISEQISIHCKN